MQSELPEIGTLWIGQKLPEIEWLCISSMVAHGHSVTLYTYEDMPVPDGVIIIDASSIIPKNEVFTYKNTGSYATFADWFRLQMIAKTGKVWLDADAALLQPLKLEDNYFFVGGNHKSFGSCVNNYVLAAPQDSEFIKDALSYFDQPEKFLYYMAWHRSARLMIKKKLTGKWNLDQFRWGVFGMGFLTDLVRKHNLEKYVHINGPQIVEGVNRIFDPISPSDLAAVKIVHFFSSGLERSSFSRKKASPGSIYEKLMLSCRDDDKSWPHSLA